MEIVYDSFGFGSILTMRYHFSPKGVRDKVKKRFVSKYDHEFVFLKTLTVYYDVYTVYI